MTEIHALLVQQTEQISPERPGHKKDWDKASGVPIGPLGRRLAGAGSTQQGPDTEDRAPLARAGTADLEADGGQPHRFHASDVVT